MTSTLLLFLLDPSSCNTWDPLYEKPHQSSANLLDVHILSVYILYSFGVPLNIMGDFRQDLHLSALQLLFRKWHHSKHDFRLVKNVATLWTWRRRKKRSKGYEVYGHVGRPKHLIDTFHKWVWLSCCFVAPNCFHPHRVLITCLNAPLPRLTFFYEFISNSLQNEMRLIPDGSCSHFRLLRLEELRDGRSRMTLPLLNFCPEIHVWCLHICTL